MYFRTLRSIVVSAVLGLVLASPTPAFAQSIYIPRLQVRAPLSYSSLNRGPLVYYQDRDTIGIAGHRTTYTRPFNQINRLRWGDRIFITLRGYRYVFSVRGVRIIRNQRSEVRRLQNYRGAILSACHPPGSAAYRYVVLATRLR